MSTVKRVGRTRSLQLPNKCIPVDVLSRHKTKDELERTRHRNYGKQVITVFINLYITHGGYTVRDNLYRNKFFFWVVYIGIVICQMWDRTLCYCSNGFISHINTWRTSRSFLSMWQSSRRLPSWTKIHLCPPLPFPRVNTLISLDGLPDRSESLLERDWAIVLPFMVWVLGRVVDPTTVRTPLLPSPCPVHRVLLRLLHPCMESGCRRVAKNVPQTIIHVYGGTSPKFHYGWQTCNHT